MNKKTLSRFFSILISLLTVTFFEISCKSNSVENSLKNSTPFEQPKKNELKLVFLGDIMAHTQNFKMKDFSLIWRDVEFLTKNSDFTFANIEAPVNNDAPFENYPTFSMQYSYPQAAINAGVNVITVANNHTNDKLFSGILETAAWSDFVSNKIHQPNRKIYVSGLKEEVLKNYSHYKKFQNQTELINNQNKKNVQFENDLEKVSFCNFEKNNIKITFLGVTQLLNQGDSYKLINYFPSTKSSKEKLLNTIKEIKAQNPTDIFVLALHTDEKEYVLEVEQSRKLFYYELLGAGVDILWSNHPHVVKPVEYFINRESGDIEKIILYATGNTISGQRRIPDFENPSTIHEYTGDGIIFSIDAIKKNDKIVFENHSINYITTFIDESKTGERNFVIKNLNQDFFDELEKNENFLWKNYLEKRLELLKEIKEIKTWQ